MAERRINIAATCRYRGGLIAIAAIVLVVLTTADASAEAKRPVEFTRDIRPMLSDKCIFCHGPDEKHRGADLRLDTRDGAFADLGGYKAIVPGKPMESELYLRLITDDKTDRMPQKKSGKTLTPEEIQRFKQWIEQGAKWEEHWAYVPPKKQAPPAVKDKTWAINDIDRFVLAKLESMGLKPSPEADRRTLLRRLSFDLTGLPPTVESVRAFVADKSADAYEKQVDRLLASKHFGERMAMGWLDLVRYADTVGYHGDQDHNIWPYRDYVIEAFNDNKPFDQFTIEQLAGDLLPKPTQAQRVATGYNRLLQTSHEGGVQPKEYLAIYAADRVRNVSAVWMGATVGCAQCHDHKYDPITIKDHYTLVAFFADIDEAQHFKTGTNSLPTRREPEIRLYTPAQQKLAESLDTQIKTLDASLRKVRGGAKSKEGKAIKAKLDAARRRRAALDKAAPRTMVTQAIKPRAIRVLPRGNWLDDSGPIVQPAVPEFLGKLATKGRATRLDLAKWFVTPRANGGVGELTARVQVNRFWATLMGTGISRVLDDFGGQGEPPVHLALLDHLALSFIEGGWNTKAAIKRIVMSRTYRQSSVASPDMLKRDPANRLHARQSRPRLKAELIRDNALAVSGLLATELGGPPVKPYQPVGYYQHLNFPKRRYVDHRDARQYRRGVYVHWQRQFLHPMLKAFDAPSREECAAERPVSNTPQAALTLLNDPTFVEAARALAVRLLTERGAGRSDASRLAWAFELLTSRPPRSEEASLLASLLRKHRAEFKADPQAAAALADVGMYKPGEKAKHLAADELAAWTSVARALLNLNEVITRN